MHYACSMELQRDFLFPAAAGLPRRLYVRSYLRANTARLVPFYCWTSLLVVFTRYRFPLYCCTPVRAKTRNATVEKPRTIWRSSRLGWGREHRAESLSSFLPYDKERRMDDDRRRKELRDRRFLHRRFTIIASTHSTNIRIYIYT